MDQSSSGRKTGYSEEIQITDANSTEGLFAVSAAFWENILEELWRYPDLIRKYFGEWLPWLDLLHQLPSSPADFIGRETELKSVRRHLQSTGATCVTVIGIRGLGGVGKTALALQIAAAPSRRCPDRGIHVPRRIESMGRRGYLDLYWESGGRLTVSAVKPQLRRVLRETV